MVPYSTLRRPLALTLCAGIFALTVCPPGGPRSAAAQDAAEPDAVLPADPIAQAREYLKTGEYDKAIQTLNARIHDAQQDPETLGDAYLLLMKSLVLFSNDFKNKGDFSTSELYLDRTRETVVEALSNPALAGLRPEPEIEFPPEMLTVFRDVRATTFGSFQVTSLQPPNAVVYLNDVRVDKGPSGELEVPNIRAGEYEVRVEAEGYRTRVETVTILPGTNQSQEYILKERRGFFWYATRGAVVATGLVVAAVVGNSAGGPSTQPDLPGPPAPPGN